MLPGLIIAAGLLGGGGIGTETSHPLDGLSPTGAWSRSRYLRSAYVGSKETITSGQIQTLLDQSGNSRNLTQGTSSARPTPATAGPNSIACADFDGSNDSLASTGFALSTFITNSAGYMVASIRIDTFPTNSASSFSNSVVLLDTLKFAGMTVRSGNIFYAYNWDGNEDKATGTTAASTVYVVEWRHEGGNVYQRVNGTGETSVASGNTSTMTGVLSMGGISGTQLFDGKLFEAVTFSSVPSLAVRDALVHDLGIWVGASV